ncbi:MAG: hypothetical protein ACOX52_22215 [Verrucomicrobiota bacterium]
MDPTHPHNQVENVTAPSAGGFPDPDGEVRLKMRLPFRTGSGCRHTWGDRLGYWQKILPVWRGSVEVWGLARFFG